MSKSKRDRNKRVKPRVSKPRRQVFARSFGGSKSGQSTLGQVEPSAGFQGAQLAQRPRFSDLFDHLAEVLTFFPAIIAAAIASGGLVLDPVSLGLWVTVLVSLFHLGFLVVEPERRVKWYRPETCAVIAGVALFSLLFWLWPSFMADKRVSDNPALPWLSAASIVLASAGPVLCQLLKQPATPSRLIFLIVARLLTISMVTLIAVLTQVGEIAIAALIIGFIPACFLAGSDILNHAPMLERAGWTWSRQVLLKSGNTAARPGKIVQLYAGISMLIPALFVSVIPFHWVPGLFVVFIYPILIATKYTSALQNQEQTVPMLAKRTELLSLLANILMLIVFLVG